MIFSLNSVFTIKWQTMHPNWILDSNRQFPESDCGIQNDFDNQKAYVNAP